MPVADLYWQEEQILGGLLFEVHDDALAEKNYLCPIQYIVEGHQYSGSCERCSLAFSLSFELAVGQDCGNELASLDKMNWGIAELSEGYEWLVYEGSSWEHWGSAFPVSVDTGEGWYFTGDMGILSR